MPAALPVFPQALHQHGRPQSHHRPIIHRVVEHRPRQHQPIHQRHGNADGKPRRHSPQHPASRRSMKINRISRPRIHRRDNIRLSLDRKSHMTNKPLIQNLINTLAVINPAMRLAHHTSSSIRCESIRHRRPRSETERKVDSRRHRGMSGNNNPMLTRPLRLPWAFEGGPIKNTTLIARALTGYAGSKMPGPLGERVSV